jgi:hypothetical protein
MSNSHSVSFLLKLHPIHYPIIADLINTPLLTTFMVDATTVSTHAVVIPALSDWVLTILAGCIWVSIIAAFDTIGEVLLT